MNRFTLSATSCTVGFYNHTTIDLHKPIHAQLNRRRLYPRRGDDYGDERQIKKIIEQNSSLRIAFGWSFECASMLSEIMYQCEKEVMPKFIYAAGNTCSDTRCDWLGFLPFDAFERSVYDDLSIYSLILFNNELIDFQTAVIEFVTRHKLYQQHAMIRDDTYRFTAFKKVRKDSVALSELFSYYVEAVKDTSMVCAVPRDILEEQIGCHFLSHPDTFFELLNFYKLKGEICE